MLRDQWGLVVRPHSFCARCFRNVDGPARLPERCGDEDGLRFSIPRADSSVDKRGQPEQENPTTRVRQGFTRAEHRARNVDLTLGKLEVDGLDVYE